MKCKNAKPERSFRLTCVSAVVMMLVMLSAAAVSAQTLDSLQRAFINQRFGMFIHFNMNTYVGGWGESRTNPLNFNPTNLNCAQWAAAAKSAGMKYGVLVCKHHDGFPIWQSRMTPLIAPAYTIAQSSQPTMDVVKSYTDAFRAAGLGPGLYISMWDVAQGIDRSVTKWTAAQKAYILGQITELLTNYGQIPIFYFDGYSWAMGHNAVPWQTIRDTIKALQPNCLIVETNGMQEPWESDILFVEEPLGLWCPSTNTYAAIQAPTISGGWFWSSAAADSNQLMTVADIITTHLNPLNQRYCNLQLNCPPNKTGVLDQAIVNRLAAVGAAWTHPTVPTLPKQPPMIERPITPLAATATSGTAFNAIDNHNDWYRGAIFQQLWTSAGTLPQSVTLDLGQVNTISMLFYLPKRDSTNGPVAPNGYITSYKVYVSSDNLNFTQIATGTDLDGGTFGVWPANSKIKRISFATQTARYVRLEANAVSGGANAIINEIGVGRPMTTSAVKSQPINRISMPPELNGRTAIGRFDCGQAYLNRVKSVAVYDLGGKLMSVTTLSKNIIDLHKDCGVPEGIYVVKVHAVK